MASVLSTEKQAAIISLLAEGSSIRSVERVTGVHRDTIMRLGVRVGKRHVTVLHVEPVTSAAMAVRAAIVQEFRNLGTANES